MQIHNIYYVLDLDRCLANTGKLYNLLEQIVAERTSVMHEGSEQAQTMTERSGGSFDTVSFVRERLEEVGQSELWDVLENEFIHRAKMEDMLEPGAKTFIKILDDAHIPYGILTFGGETWQRMKLQATNLEKIPYLITHTKEKGRLLASWRQANGTFQLPEELVVNNIANASSLVLVDDKVISFVDLPQGVKGILVRPEGNTSASETVVPEAVVQVRDLIVAKDLIKT